MNEMIERYIYDVIRRLPEKERNEVGRELEASITDMLPDEPREQDVMDVLTKLGEPRLLAEQYRQKPQYLISPAMYDIYISALKMVTMIVAAVLASIGAFSAIMSGSLAKIFANAVGMAFEGALHAALWITVGFVIAEKCGFKNEPWTIADLPSIPDQTSVKISRLSTIIEIILTVLFTSLFFKRLLIFIRDSEVIIPFSETALHRFIPYLIIFALMSLVIQVLKLYWAKWNLPLCIANIIYNTIWVILAIHILHWKDLLSNEFVELISNLNILPNLSVDMIIVFISFVFIFIVLIDIILSIWNTRKGMRKI